MNNNDHEQESRKSSQYEAGGGGNNNNTSNALHNPSMSGTDRDQSTDHPEHNSQYGNNHHDRNDNYNHASGGPNFEHPSPNFMDSQWANSLLMDPGASDYLYNIDLAAAAAAVSSSTTTTNISTNAMAPSNPSSIMQSIQYQHNIQPEGHQLPNDHFDSMRGVPERVTSAASDSNASDSSKAKQRRPCDQCRRRKTKCVIVPNTNNCVQCEAKQLSCTYNNNNNNNNNNNQQIKRKPIDMDAVQVSNESSQKRPRSDLNPNLAILAGDTPNSVIQTPGEYPSNPLAKKKATLQFPRSSFYVGPTSYLYDVNLLNLIMDSQTTSAKGTKVEQLHINNSISLRKVSDKVQFLLKDDQSPQSYQAMSNDVDTIEKLVSPHGQVLIDLYFRIIHPSYPIIHKKVFLEKYSRTHREFSAPLLAAVYVLAIQWWDYDPQLNRFPKPNVEIILKIGLNNYLQEILKRPKLSAVQAGLLLLQCKHITNDQATQNPPGNQSPTSFPNRDINYSEWILCSQVVSLSEELGLGLDCHNWKLPKWERGLRKRLAWAVYNEDKWLALRCSRPSHIHDNNWVVDPLNEEDFPDDGDKEGSTDTENGKKIFMNLIELGKILSDMLNHLYSMRAMSEITEVNQVLSIAKPLQLRLRNWYHSLPAELQMASVQPRKLCSNGYLQLAYFSTELTLHRKIITVIYQQTKNGSPPPMELVNVCRGAAKTRIMASIEFVRDLKPEHIHSFWHSFSSANFTLIGIFATILFMSAPTREESNFYRDQIFNYRWILKMSSKGFDQAAESLTELDLILSRLPGFNDNGEIMSNASEQRQQYYELPQDQHQQQQQLPQNPAMTFPPPRSTPSTYNGKTTPRMRMAPQLESNDSTNQSPYNSPQNYYPATNSPHNQQPQSKGSFAHSPLTNALSPKEVIKQRQVSNSRTSSIVNEHNTPGSVQSGNTPNTPHRGEA
ncbi:uncharacterized protein SPAPADRAFT_65645 [Spathaspora passalidarum NRRL Y-27907]|uniref:Zn(2)-C6 fungal-type domain-containing protein n=1 Tax=Spathaspora passalidarum (strain NRRL Y-27907 / 11-Y1) TaxID=619300 RepID=G3AJ03_SPAPN|nr:uncharacterized protein SPAPADRAFT_65645 [Spathaspora passalidarum NRRL Y-27907]EGW34514.1 hypothetical protein SPAPADRAFT_65645 [Spathaspora passalidarum NRRL Y-27907]